MVEDPNSGLPADAIATLRVLVAALTHLEEEIGKLDGEITRRAKENEVARRLMTVPGIGPLIATAIAVLAPPPGSFRRGRDFAAWLGLTPRQHSTGGKQRLRAHAVRAIRLASATATSIFGLRASIRASQEPSGAPLRAAHRTTATAPMISNRRMSRWPIFEVRPSRSLPPLECWRGVRPTQAAKSRPLEKLSTGGAKVVIAAAVTAPTPGIVVSRRAASSALARRRSSVSRPAIFPASPTICSSRRRARASGACGTWARTSGRTLRG